MVIGENFAWSHLLKTGGDATLTLFGQVPDLVTEVDSPDTNAKHDTFQERGVAHKPRLVMNLRRLPAWILSLAWHAHRYGGYPDYTPQRLRSAAELCEMTVPDQSLLRHLDGGRVVVTDWLRMEHLRQDFLHFVSSLRPLSHRERQAILTVETKAPADYEHDTGRFFSRRQTETLYARNPVWRGLEEEVYGSAFLQAVEPGPAKRPAR